jgi:hypothetical protein
MSLTWDELEQLEDWYPEDEEDWDDYYDDNGYYDEDGPIYPEDLEPQD